MTTDKDERATLTFDEVFAGEIAHIRQTRLDDTLERRITVDPENVAGLALSGGGIRSASFALGVLQALVVERALSRFEYLSTVSGGGYIGCALSWLLSQLPGSGLTPGTFPLSSPLAGTRHAQGTEARLRALDFIRQRGNYLAPSRKLSLLAGMAFVLRGMTATLAVYFGLVLAMLLALHSALLLGNATWRPGAALSNDAAELVTQVITWGAGWIAGLSAAVFFGLSVLSWASPNLAFRPLIGADRRRELRDHPSALPYFVRLFTQRAFGISLQGLLACLGLAGLFYLGPTVDRLLTGQAADALLPVLVGSSGALIAALGKRPQPGQAGRLPVMMVAAALVLIGFLWLAQLLAQRMLVVFIDELHDPAGAAQVAIVVAGLLEVVALFAAWRINANDTSLHRFYRDRLMETFLPDADRLQGGGWEPAAKADAARLDQMCGAGRDAIPYAGPYHLINANVVLTGSARYCFSGRTGDSFLLSPLHVGSDATGWLSTARYGQSEDDGRGITLATAMATSGAAANPNAGVGGTGLTRSRLVSVLMTLLNIRLGYWLVNPARLPVGKSASWPNLLQPAAWNMLGEDLREDSQFLQITDGGHFDNTGVYELVRRRCRLIVLSEAGADERFEFADLASMIERIRVDFAVNVDFIDEFGLERLSSGERAASGYAIARLRYADTGAEGFLVIVKPTLTEGLPADLYARRAQYPSFPHESTADQFFNEAQFEAYRELGYRLARRAVFDIRTDRRLDGISKIWRL